MSKSVKTYRFGEFEFDFAEVLKYAENKLASPDGSVSAWQVDAYCDGARFQFNKDRERLARLEKELAEYKFMYEGLCK